MHLVLSVVLVPDSICGSEVPIPVLDQALLSGNDGRACRHAGNGEPSMVMYGENVAPNHHQLARDYVLLDNLYCNSEVSVDGHSWCDAAMATDFNERKWMMSYSKHGSLPGNDEMEAPTAGYLRSLRSKGASLRSVENSAAAAR